MTDEQIRQNAKAYAIKICEETPIDYSVVSDAYIAGAHSRDREVMDLENLLKVERTSNKVLVEVNVKLRDPWISVEERLPDYPESEYDIDNMYLVCREGGSFVFPAIFRRNGKWYIYDHMQTIEIITPDYWMPMPELKKG